MRSIHTLFSGGGGRDTRDLILPNIRSLHGDILVPYIREMAVHIEDTAGQIISNIIRVKRISQALEGYAYQA